MTGPSSSFSPEDQHFADFVRLWNQITDKHAVDALMKFAAEEAATSLPLSDKSILSHPPMELTDEEKKQFAAMWDNVPPENVLTLDEEEFNWLLNWLNNPPPPNERLIKFMTTPSVLEKLSTDEPATNGMQQLWQHSENYLQQLRQEIHKKMGVPENLASDNLPPNV